MNLLQVTSGVLDFAQGVDLKAIQSKADLFIKDVKEMGKRCDEITIAHALYIAKQQHWIDGGKGNTEAAGQWLIQLQANNRNWYDSAIKFYRKVLGLNFRVHREDDEAKEQVAECSVVIFEDRDHAVNKAKLGAMLVGAYENGISYDTTGAYAKISLPKKAQAKRGNKDDTSPSNVLEVSNSQVVSEKIGIAQVLADASDEEVQALGEVGSLIAQIIEHGKHNKNRKQLLEILTSTVEKLNKGFNLSAAMKKVAEAA